MSKLDRKAQDRALKTISKFERMPGLPGLELEKLGGFQNLWSIRVSQGDRILLSKGVDEEGELWTLEDIGPHDVYRRVGR